MEVTEPFIILAGKGMTRDCIREGIRITAQFQVQQIEEYFERLVRCGMPERRERSKLWQVYEMAKAAAEAAAHNATQATSV